MHITETLPNLPPATARYTFHTLISALPPPVPDTAEERATRDEDAIAAVAALYPADAFEARLAARIVATDSHAMDCLRSAIQPGLDPLDVRRCRAQANSMMRQSQSALHALQRRQAAREKAEAATNPAAMERAGYWFRDVSVPAPDESRAPHPAPSAQPAPPEPIVQPPHAERAAPAPATLSEAEQYAVIYPDRAAIIRANGGLPARLDFGPPEPDIVEAIVNGTSPILRALDRRPRAAVTA